MFVLSRRARARAIGYRSSAFKREKLKLSTSASERAVKSSTRERGRYNKNAVFVFSCFTPFPTMVEENMNACALVISCEVCKLTYSKYIYIAL